LPGRPNPTFQSGDSHHRCHISKMNSFRKGCTITIRFVCTFLPHFSVYYCSVCLCVCVSVCMFLKIAGNFLNGCTIGSFSGRSQLRT
jgi:hypothetical protein